MPRTRSKTKRQKTSLVAGDANNSSTAVATTVSHAAHGPQNAEAAFSGPAGLNNMSLEILCFILGYLPVCDVLKLESLSHRLQQAVNMHLHLLTELDLCEGQVYGWLPMAVTDTILSKLLCRCTELVFLFGLHPRHINKRRQRTSDSLSIPGVLAALKVCPNLQGVETCDVFLLEAITDSLRHLEILGSFKNRGATFPVLHTNRISLTRNARIRSLNLTSVVIPHLPRMDHLKHLYLKWVKLTDPHPFRDFGVPMLRTFVMSNCAGPSNALKYVPLITGLAAASSLARMELIRVPFLGGLIQHVVEDSWKMHGFRNLQKIVLGSCKHTLEVDLGYLCITCCHRLEEVAVQPSLTKDSFFSSLALADVTFPVFDTLTLGYVDDFISNCKWTNQELVNMGLADYAQSPAMITDIGMRAAGLTFQLVRSLKIYNCPLLHMPTSWFSTGHNSWANLQELHLVRCHAINLEDFCRVLPLFQRLLLLTLVQMFHEPPKGCSRVGLSAGTGLGVSSALVSNTAGGDGAAAAAAAAAPAPPPVGANQNAAHNNNIGAPQQPDAGDGDDNDVDDDDDDNDEADNISDVGEEEEGGGQQNDLPSAAAPGPSEQPVVHPPEPVPAQSPDPNPAQPMPPAGQPLSPEPHAAQPVPPGAQPVSQEPHAMQPVPLESCTAQPVPQEPCVAQPPVLPEPQQASAVVDESVLQSSSERAEEPSSKEQLSDSDAEDDLAAIRCITHPRPTKSAGHSPDLCKPGRDSVEQSNSAKESSEQSSSAECINDVEHGNETEWVRGAEQDDSAGQRDQTKRSSLAKQSNSAKHSNNAEQSNSAGLGNSAEHSNNAEQSSSTGLGNSAEHSNNAEQSNSAGLGNSVEHSNNAEQSSSTGLCSTAEHRNSVGLSYSIEQSSNAGQSNGTGQSSNAHQSNSAGQSDCEGQGSSVQQSTNAAAETAEVARSTALRTAGNTDGDVPDSFKHSAPITGPEHISCQRGLSNSSASTDDVKPKHLETCKSGCAKARDTTEPNSPEIPYSGSEIAEPGTGQSPMDVDIDDDDMFSLSADLKLGFACIGDDDQGNADNPMPGPSGAQKLGGASKTTDKASGTDTTCAKCGKYVDVPQETQARDGKSSPKMSTRKGKSLSGKKKGLVKRRHSDTESSQVNQSCQAISEEIRESTKKDATEKPASPDQKQSQHLPLSAGTSSERKGAAEATGVPSTSGTGTTEDAKRGSGIPRRRVETQDQATSTSDPVVEEDHLQELTLKSASLVCINLQHVGVTTLVLEDLPKLEVFTATACRVLVEVRACSTPNLSQVCVTQCRKLRHVELVDSVLSQPPKVDRHIILRPMHKYNDVELERHLLSCERYKYHMCLVRDHSTDPERSLPLRHRLESWVDLASKINQDLIKAPDVGITEEGKRGKTQACRFPWGRDIYTLRCLSGSGWDLTTDISWFRPLQAIRQALAANPEARGQPGAVDLTGPSFHIALCQNYMQDDLAESEELGQTLYKHCALVYVNTCDMSGIPKPDKYV